MRIVKLAPQKTGTCIKGSPLNITIYSHKENTLILP